MPKWMSKCWSLLICVWWMQCQGYQCCLNPAPTTFSSSNRSGRRSDRFSPWSVLICIVESFLAKLVFRAGAPYKYDRVYTTHRSYPIPSWTYSQTIKTHTKFVQDVRYSPSGDHFASVGSDAKIFIYDGKTGDTLNEFTEIPHTGSIVCHKVIELQYQTLILILDGMFLESR